MLQPSGGDDPKKISHFRRSQDINTPKKSFDVSRPPKETQDERRDKILKATESRISHSNRSDVKTPPLDVSRQSLKEIQYERRGKTLNVSNSRMDHSSQSDINITKNSISSTPDIVKQLSKRNVMRDKAAEAAEAAEKRRDNESKDEAIRQIILQQSRNNRLEAKEQTEQDAPPQVNRIGNIEHVEEALNNDKTIYTYWNRKDSSIFFTNDLRKVDEEFGKGIAKLGILQSLADNSNIQRIDPGDGLNKVERFGLGYKVDIAPERIEQVPQRSHAVPQEFRPEQAQIRFSIGEIPFTTDNPLPAYHTEQGSRVANNAQNMLLHRSIEEGYHIIYNTQHMSFEQRRQMQQRWLDSVPQQFRNLLHNITTEELNEQQHEQRIHDIIQDKKLNIQVPNQKAQEWAKFAANLISKYEDEIINPTTGERRGLGQSHLLGDILQGGTRVEASWNEIRNSDEYKALMTWALTKWQEWPGRKQQERSRPIIDQPTPHTFTVNEQVPNRQNRPNRQSPPALDIPQTMSEINANPNRQNPATVDIPGYNTETKAGPDSQSSATVDIPKPLQETQEAEHYEASLAPNIFENDTDNGFDTDDIITSTKKKRKEKFFIFTEKYKGSLSDYVPITPDKTEKAQKAQELERIQQEQMQQEYFLNKVAEEINRFLNKQANLAEFDEQRAREMQEDVSLPC